MFDHGIFNKLSVVLQMLSSHIFTTCFSNQQTFSLDPALEMQHYHFYGVEFIRRDLKSRG